MATKLPPSLAATDGVQYVIRKQAEIEQRLAALEQDLRNTRLEIAQQLEALAKDIGYPINDIAKTRKHLRDLAARLRTEARHG